LDVIEVKLRQSDEAAMLTDDERSELDSLLELNADLFALTGPATPHAEHQIDTGNHAPIAGPPYRVSPAKQRLLRSEVDYLLSEDIIEECESPWASPEVLVPKPDGSQRLCIDYRKLNAITQPDVCPLPRVEELLHSTGNAKYITTLDLWSGYYQIKMYEPDQDKTAFIIPFGVYRFKRVPFGLRPRYLSTTHG
jgi:hypothetical protein